MQKLLFAAIFLGLIACTSDQGSNFRPVDWVDPFIGTGGHGHTYPGATMPFGMVQLSPDTRLTGWDGCGGYHDSDSLIYGFSHTHLQGTGISDYGDILIMPTNNEVRTGENWGERYRSAFRKETEKAEAGYYSVVLDDHNLTAELTATRRVGVHRYSYNNTDSCVVFIDMAHRDELIAYQIEPVNDTLIVGFRQSNEWATDQLVYFAMAFDHPFEWLDQTFDYFYEEDPETGEMIEVTAYVPVFPLKFGALDTLQVKTALAATSIDAAIENLNAEAPHWNFDAYRMQAEETWNKELSKIVVEGDNDDDLTNFYTALYHSMTVPNTFTDVNGNYRSTDLAAHEADGHEQYTVFSLWDTYRATHPLYTIIERERTLDFIKSFLDMYQHGGKLPMWELAGNYTHCMIGYHSVPVIVDAYRKGITDFDQQLALEAMVAAAEFDEFGKHEYDRNGYLASEVEHESVSKTMEYAYNDWCISEFARMINGEDDPTYLRFRRRALSYRNLFDEETGFIRPKRGGAFIDGFDPREVNFNYTEANGWQYNFYTPQDVNGHIRIMGGDDAYIAKLDSMFFGNSELLGRAQADITGLIGQYAHGNEPSHHMAYLYSYAGQPWKTQMLVDSIMDNLYTPTPDGLSGNEDCGQMSSWYVLSALGFYPVTPGSDLYVLGTPRFDEAVIRLENGNEFKVIAEGLRKGPYVASVELNGKPYTHAYLLHKDIMKGGELTFFMSATPVEEFGAAKHDRPQARTTDDRFFPVPVINAPRTFRDSATVTLTNFEDDATIYFRTVTPEGEESDWKAYSTPFTIFETTEIQTYAESGRRHSKQVSSNAKKITHDYSISIGASYDNQYAAGGDNALIDGITGTDNFKTGEWQGYYGKDVSFVVDLGEVRSITSVSVGALQDVKPWIWLPPYVTLSVSNDGEHFTEYHQVHHDVAIDDYLPQSYRFVSRKPVKGRYVRVMAPSFGEIPDWHLGHGNPSWLFFDEIDIQTK